MSKLLTSLSIIGLLATSNIIFAGGGDNGSVPFSGYSTQQLNDWAKEVNNLHISSDAVGASLVGLAWSKDAKEAVKKDKAVQGKDEYPDSEKSTISKLETIYELNGLQYNSIFGLLLDFSEGQLSIENLEQEMINKIKACQKKEKELLGNIEESSEIKMYAETITGMWELYAKIVSTDKKNLQEQKTSLAKLRERYAKLAAGWFSNKYGMKDKEGVAKIKLEQKEGNAIKLSSYAGTISTELQDIVREIDPGYPKSDETALALVAGMSVIRDRVEQEGGNVQNKDPYLAFSELEREYAKSKLSLDYLYGLFLSYGERNIAITKFKNDLDYQLKICKQKEIEKNKHKNISNYEYKAYTQLLREVWEEAKEDLEDEMMELQVEDTDLRESYKIKAVEWFLQKYQPGGDGGIDGVSIGWKEQAKKKKKKCRAEKKLGKVAREFNCLNLEKSWMKDEFYGARSKIEKEEGTKDGKR